MCSTMAGRWERFVRAPIASRHRIAPSALRSSSRACAHRLLGEYAVHVLQVDLDLGNYERFLDVTLRRDNNLTTGKVYQVRGLSLCHSLSTGVSAQQGLSQSCAVLTLTSFAERNRKGERGRIPRKDRASCASHYRHYSGLDRASCTCPRGRNGRHS